MFEHERKFFICRTSHVKEFVKKRNRFRRTLVMTLAFYIQNKKEVINATVPVFKDRTLTNYLHVSFNASFFFHKKVKNSNNL